MAYAIKVLSKPLGLHVIKNPAGTFSFVGSVPAECGYVDPTDDQIRIAREFGPGLAKMKVRTFATEEDAINFATARGYKVSVR